MFTLRHKKIFVIIYPILGFLINIFKIVWQPFILSFRARARVVVYNYMLKEHNYSLLGYKYSDTFNYYNQIDNSIYLEKEDISRKTFLLYFYLVWIWLDDNNHDIIALDKIIKGFKTDKTIKLITTQYQVSAVNSFKNPLITYELSKNILLWFISLFYSSNNFTNYFKYRYTFETKYKDSLYLQIFKYKIGWILLLSDSKDVRFNNQAFGIKKEE